MALKAKYSPGQLVQITISDHRYVGLVLSTTPAPRRGMSPMLKVEWVGEAPRDYQVEYISEQGLRLVK
jgi:hypothetical protein